MTEHAIAPLHMSKSRYYINKPFLLVWF